MKVFLHGIGGVGMSSLAGLFKEKGFDVAGSDSDFYPPVDGMLKEMKVTLHKPYSSNNIPLDIDFSVLGNIISRGNPEAEYILNNNIEYYSMAEALYEFFIKNKNSIVVAGTHGKTTTSSFIAFLLTKAGINPGFFIGGKPLNLSSNYGLGNNSEYFVTEGDEYETSFFDRSSKFLKYYPKFLILTSLEYDHIDFFKDSDLYLKSFSNLVNQVPSNGLIIVNGDYQMNHRAVKKSFTPVISYGHKKSDVLIKEILATPDNMSFKLQIRGKTEGFTTKLQGDYNVGNLTAGIILGDHLGIDLGIIREAVKEFRGVERRLNQIKKIDKTIIYEDFAHHPTSIGCVIGSLKKSYPEYRIITVFEPGNASLKRNVFQTRLIQSFKEVDILLMKDLPENLSLEMNQKLDTKLIIKKIKEMGKDAVLFTDFERIKQYLKDLNFKQKNLIVLMSNGSFGDIPGFVKTLS